MANTHRIRLAGTDSNAMTRWGHLLELRERRALEAGISSRD
ncbi:MAG TPA: hypothetical protein ACN46N_05480 [Prochlorococcus sp.]